MDRNSGRLFSHTGENRITNKNLDVIVRKASDHFDRMRFLGDSFSINELVDNIKGKEAAPILRTKKELSNNTACV